MTGRISEESNEAFNATLANVKSRLRCMPTTSTRIETTNARTTDTGEFEWRSFEPEGSTAGWGERKEEGAL